MSRSVVVFPMASSTFASYGIPAKKFKPSFSVCSCMLFCLFIFMFSTTPITGIFRSRSRLESFFTVSNANFEGVVTMMNSMRFTRRMRSRTASPIQGGMSMMR